jgi:cytochrome c-type biogenesis protein CcmH
MPRAAALLALLLAACKGEPPAPQPGVRPAARGLPPAEPGQAHPVAPAEGPGTRSAGELSGEIDVAPSLVTEVKPGDAIFIVARSLDTAGNPSRQALAVDRVEVGKLPVTFQLTAAHMMSAGTFAGPVAITARLDRDGEALSRTPGDLEGTARAVIPAQGVKILLDTKVGPE